MSYVCWAGTGVILLRRNTVKQIKQRNHYGDVIMGTMASQITSLIIVYSTAYSGADQRNHQTSVSLAFLRGIHRGPVNSPFPTQMASNAENVSIWCHPGVLLLWRKHVIQSIGVTPTYTRTPCMKNNSIRGTLLSFAGNLVFVLFVNNTQ